MIVRPRIVEPENCTEVAMPRRSENLFEMLVQVPWWISIIVAFIMFVGLKFVIPAILKGHILFTGLAMLVAAIAPWVALLCLFCGAMSAYRSWRRGELLRGQTSISTIRNLSWRAFEDLVTEVYSRQGYSVTGNSGPGADGGVDVIARKDGETILVQCKRWKARKLGVRTVREMFGLLNAERANEVHIVSSGYFTDEAIEFARNKPIRLIDGGMLVKMVGRVQAGNTHSTRPSGVLCPKCGASMVLRTATKGPSEGQKFWGCERFPACRGIRLVKSTEANEIQ